MTPASRARPIPPLADNVTQLAAAERRIHEAEARSRDLLNALPAAIYTTNAQGKITFCNDAAVALVGRRPVLGVDEWCVTWRLYDGDGSRVAHHECAMAVAVKEGRAGGEVEAIAERPDGSRVLFAAHPTPLRDETGAVIGGVNMMVDITHLKQAEERQSLLANEVNHRANNLLAVVGAVVRLTQADTVEAFKTAVAGRIGALATANNLLAKSHWAQVDLAGLIGEALKADIGGETPRAWISGAAMPLDPKMAQALATILHELATNAARHGALTSAAGHLRVAWRAPMSRLIIEWTETGRPVMRPPARDGVGLKVIRASVAQVNGEVRFDWRAAGLACEISIPLPVSSEGSASAK